MVFGDRGDEMVERGNAEVLVGGAHLMLQLGGPALGALGEPQPWQLAWIDWGKVATGSCLEQQRRARGDDASRDPFGHPATAVGVELRAAQSPERAGVEQHKRGVH